VKTRLYCATILALVIALTAFAVALADPPDPTPGPHHPRFGRPPAGGEFLDHFRRRDIFGSVTSKAPDSFTVQMRQGSQVVLVTSATNFHIPAKPNATFADLNVNDHIVADGVFTSTTFTARQVLVEPTRPTISHQVGTVTAYTAASSITIQNLQGQTVTVALNSQTAIRDPKNVGVSVGAKVTIISRTDPATNTTTATTIFVFPH
jgi:hypothetical protein